MGQKDKDSLKNGLQITNLQHLTNPNTKLNFFSSLFHIKLW